MTRTHIESQNLLQRVRPLLEAGDARSALALIERYGSDTLELKNARGICLLRLGQIEKALRLFSSIVLHQGTTYMVQGLPNTFKTNFATALLLANNVSGCVAVLDEINDEKDPAVIRLRKAVEDWKGRLNPLRRILFNLYGESSRPPVTLDFVPGDLTDPLHLRPAA